MKGRSKKSSGVEVADLYTPSAPIPTGTFPRHGFRPRNPRGHTAEVDENDAVPSAPPLDLMDHVIGYETISFNAVSIPPPELGPETGSTEGCNREVVPSRPPVSEQQARAALQEHVSQHCCYGRGAAKEMAITNINYSSAFHYKLHSFTERRETSWAFTPYGGGDIDGCEGGNPPLPWSIEAYPAIAFEDEVKLIEVPHTASIKQCHRCKGSGNLLCSECHGKGSVYCLSCHGDGWNSSSNGYKERCFYCHSSTHGHGRQDCLKCNAKGKVPCPPCDSYGQIRCFIQLTITWKVNSSEHIVERMSLPEELVRSVTGQIAFEEEAPRVTPINHFPDETINMASVQLLQSHTQMQAEQRLLAQKQVVYIIPVTEISYQWRSRNGVFYVYGFENKIYAPDYPQKCCCGCIIL